MTLILAFLFISVSYCEDMIVTREYTDYLKKHVSWEVMDYEDNVFRGWTREEMYEILAHQKPEPSHFPLFEDPGNLPDEIPEDKEGCNTGSRDYKMWSCDAAVATVDMLTQSCCNTLNWRGGWLSVQELYSCGSCCADTASSSCSMDYDVANGIVPETCLPYVGMSACPKCPEKCSAGDTTKTLKESRKCKCSMPVQCPGTSGSALEQCLKVNVVTFSMGFCDSFASYKSGVYICDCTDYKHYHWAKATGVKKIPYCYVVATNNWGVAWGNNGLFNVKCDSCNIAPGQLCQDFYR